jgi:hypothetical protein
MVFAIATLLAVTLSDASAPVPAAEASAAAANDRPAFVVPSDTATDSHPAPTTQSAVLPEPPAHQHRLLVMPYVGVEEVSLKDEITFEAGNFGSGTRVGTLVGMRINRSFSLNAGVAFDLGSKSSAPEGYYGSLTGAQFALCPLMHLRLDSVEVLAGPKVGLEFGSESSGNGAGGPQAASWRGLTYGAQFGVFFRIVPVVSLGALFAIDLIQPSARTCDWSPGCLNTSYPAPYPVTSAMVALLF